MMYQAVGRYKNSLLFLLASRKGLRAKQAGITTAEKLQIIERKMAHTKQVQRKKCTKGGKGYSSRCDGTKPTSAKWS